MEDNKLIAHFMGDDYSIAVATVNEKGGYYHSSWDWLMPCYDKLTKDFDVAWKITSKGVNIHNHGNGFDGLWEVNCPDDVIKDAHRGLVDYIKWHNANMI